MTEATDKDAQCGTQTEQEEKEIVHIRWDGGDETVMEMSQDEIEQEGVPDEWVISEDDLVMKREHLPAQAKFALGTAKSPLIPQPGLEDDQ